MIEVFPVVLCHQSEEGQESPAESVKTRVAVIWVPTHFQTLESIRALSVLENKTKTFFLLF